MNIEQVILECFGSYTDKDIKLTEDFIQLFSVETHLKGQSYIRENSRWSRFSIIIHGVFRLYYLSGDGKEHTKGLFSENHILAPHAPSAINLPVSFEIESFEDTLIISANYHDVRAYLESCEWGNSLLIGMLEKILNDKVEREHAWLNLDAESRYLNFQKKNASLFERLPLYITASYLGMTDVTLSRVRKKLSLLT
jgi:CRP-like cAMP-binding protein